MRNRGKQSAAYRTAEYALGPGGARWLWLLLGRDEPPTFAYERLTRVLDKPRSVRAARLEWERHVQDCLQRRAIRTGLGEHPDLEGWS